MLTLSWLSRTLSRASSTFGRKLFLAAGILTGISFGFAQDLDWAAVLSWGDQPAIFMLSMTAIVAILRGDPPRVDGRFAVGALSVGSGAAIGLGLSFLTGISVEPFAEMHKVVGGLAYGGIIGLSNFLGVNLIDVLVARFTKKPKAEPPKLPSEPGVKDPSIPRHG